MSAAGSNAEFECRPLSRGDRSSFCALFASAFERDPSMGYFFGEGGRRPSAKPPFGPGEGSAAGTDSYRLAMAGFLFDKALSLGEPLEGTFSGIDLAACYVAEPRADGPSIPQILRLIPSALALSARLPGGSLGRMNRFAAFARGGLPEGRWRYLTMIASSPAYRGRGAAAALLDRASEAAASETDCLGLALDTENADNVTYYERRGFELVSTGEFESLHVFRMIRPKEA